VVNLRGKIIPVIDLRLRFDMGRTETDGRTCIVVVQVNLADSQPTQMGMVVDAVEEVVNIGGSEIEETPTFGARLRSDYILGMAKVKGKLKALLDIDRVIRAETLTKLALPV
jgi:purine-binding chemotaxis protein CheW